MATFTLAANLSMMYGEVPLEQRFAAAQNLAISHKQDSTPTFQ